MMTAATVKTPTTPATRWVHPSRRPVEISLWGNPEQVWDLSIGTHLQVRARRYFDANPDAEFYLDHAAHTQLANLNRRNVFNGSLGHPRTHAFNTRRFAEIEGPGPHGLVLKRGWHPLSVAESNLSGPIPAGVVIVSNVPVDFWFKDPAEREFVARFLWNLWERAIGTQDTAVPPVGDVLAALDHTLAAHKLR